MVAVNPVLFSCLLQDFFAAFFLWQRTAILKDNFLHDDLGVAGLCLDPVELDANSLLGRMAFVVLVLK